MVFRHIALVRIPNARAIAASFLDMVPPRDNNLGDTVSLFGIVSSQAHYDSVKNLLTESRAGVFAILSMGEELARFRQEEPSVLLLFETTVR
jgi:hypothetical protein